MIVQKLNKGSDSPKTRHVLLHWGYELDRFKDILIKMINKGRDSPKTRQVLLHWGYELNGVMGYYDKNKGKLLKKAHEKYHNGGGKERLPSIIKIIKKTLKKRKKQM